MHFDPYSSARLKMISEQLRGRGIRDELLLTAMSQVPRHEFIRKDVRAQAYEDHPIAIPDGQTISQPFMVASMIEAAEIKPTDIVLEIGTGSGYQAAVLAELARHVFTIERFPSLAEGAAKALRHLDYANITVVQADGSRGWLQSAPYDAIIVAAASPRVPNALFEQLREGGRLVIPVGEDEYQELQVVKKVKGEKILRCLYKCKFVPLIGEHGFSPR